jgi:NitT/TauT family transport system substrate-binding protein
MKRLSGVLVALLAAFAFAGGAGSAFAKDRIRIAAQHGLGYAPLFIIAQKPDFIHKYAPDVDVTLVQLAGGAAVREALLSDTVDIGGLAMSPVIQAWAKGADLKLALALCDMPAELITWRPDLHSVKDLKPGDKLNVISIGSPQSLALMMAAQKIFGNPHALDSRFVTLSHPDGVAAVMTHRDIVATFASPPYVRMLLKETGMHSILSNHDFPESNFTFISAAAGGAFVKRTRLYDATVRALEDAIVWINTKPEEAAQFLAKEQGGKLTAADWLAEIKQPGAKFSPVPHGLAALGAFMAKIGMAAKAPSYDDVTWPNLHNVHGS